MRAVGTVANPKQKCPNFKYIYAQYRVKSVGRICIFTKSTK